MGAISKTQATISTLSNGKSWETRADANCTKVFSPKTSSNCLPPPFNMEKLLLEYITMEAVHLESSGISPR